MQGKNGLAPIGWIERSRGPLAITQLHTFVGQHKKCRQIVLQVSVEIKNKHFDQKGNRLDHSPYSTNFFIHRSHPFACFLIVDELTVKVRQNPSPETDNNNTAITIDRSDVFSSLALIVKHPSTT